jgi:hypothetical protein
MNLDNLNFKENARGLKLGEKLISQVKLRANKLN